MIGQRSVKYPPNQAIEVTANVATTFVATDLRTETSMLGAPTYAWDFGDGTVVGGSTVAQTWVNPTCYRLRLTITDGPATEIYDRIVRVGLDAGKIGGDLLRGTCAYEAVLLIRLPLPDGVPILAIVPLLAASAPYAEPDDLSATAVLPLPADAVDLTSRMLQVYSQRALMLPTPEPDTLAEGLYLLFPRDIIYAGQSEAIAKLAEDLRDTWRLTELRDSLNVKRKWTLPSVVDAAMVSSFAAILPAILDPTNGFGWLAPGLSSMQYATQVGQNAQQDTSLSSASLAQGQQMLAPTNSLARDQALTWLLVVGGGICSELRAFGEARGAPTDPGGVLYPSAIVLWNTHDATMAWSALASQTNDADSPIQNYWIHGAATFGIGADATEAITPTLQSLPRITTAPGRRMAVDSETRQMLGEDRELSDHIIFNGAGSIGVRMRTGEIFGENGSYSTAFEDGVHVVAAIWAGLAQTGVQSTPPALQIPAIAEAVTEGGQGVEQSLIGRYAVPGAIPLSELALDTALAVTRIKLRRGGEVRYASRPQSAGDPSNNMWLVTGTLGPYALGQLERTVNEVEPLRNPLKMAVLGSV